MKKKITQTSWLFVFLAFALAAASTQLKVTFQGTTQIAGYSFLVTSILEAVLQIGSAVLFVLGLKDFKTELKHSYLLIVSGIVLLGLARLQVPVFQVLNLWDTAWIDYGWIESISTIAQLLIFMGLLSFAELLHIKTKLLSWVPLILVLLLSTVIVWFIPHSSTVVTGGTELSFDLFSIFGVIEVVFGFFSVLLLLKVKKNTSPAYASALAWLFLAVLVTTLSTLQVVVLHFFGFQSLYVRSGMILLPGLIASVLYLKAGQSFNFISSY